MLDALTALAPLTAVRGTAPGPMRCPRPAVGELVVVGRAITPRIAELALP